jgi:plastocyanin
MSKVQVDTIVDKDDISAPSLTKGAIVTGVCTATSFDGAISEWVLGANGSSDYTFTGSGLTGAENDPTLYLKRGQKYRFKNSSGGHPFRIQSTANGSTGTAYNDGVTNNDAGDGTTLEWDVQFDAPDVLYYQCTSHGGMGGKIYIGNSGNSSTLVDLNVSGISTTVNLNVSGVTTTGIATVTTSVVVGSAVTANADGVITAGVGTFGSVVSSGAISGTTGTFTGDIDIADKIVHTGDTDTAIRFSGADKITAETGGSERLLIDSTGNLSIGGCDVNTFSNYRTLTIGGSDASTGSGLDLELSDGTIYGRIFADTNGLQIGAPASGDYIRFETDGGTERLRIGSSGEIGLAVASGVSTDYGTSGQVLTSAGSGSAVQWADAGGGQWKKLTSGTATSGQEMEVTTSLLDSSYVAYKLEWYLVFASGNSTLDLFQYHDGAYNSSTNYDYNIIYNNENGSTFTRSGGSSYAGIPIMYHTGMREMEGEIKVWRPYETGYAPIWNSKSFGARATFTDGCMTICQSQGAYTESGGVKTPTGFKLYAGATIGYANWHLYGLT